MFIDLREKVGKREREGGRQEERKEGREGGRKEGEEEGRKERRKEERELMWERTIGRFPPTRALTGNQTHNLLVYGMTFQPTEPSGQGWNGMF